MSRAERTALRTALTVLAGLLANPLDRPEARILAVRAALEGLDGEGGTTDTETPPQAAQDARETPEGASHAAGPADIRHAVMLLGIAVLALTHAGPVPPWLPGELRQVLRAVGDATGPSRWDGYVGHLDMPPDLEPHLRRAGITRIAQLRAMPENRLRLISGIGPARLRAIRAALAAWDGRDRT